MHGKRQFRVERKYSNGWERLHVCGSQGEAAKRMHQEIKHDHLLIVQGVLKSPGVYRMVEIRGRVTS